MVVNLFKGNKSRQKNKKQKEAIIDIKSQVIIIT